MRDTDIHIGLENQIMRDHIAIGLVKNFEEECENKKQYVPYNETDPFLWAIEDAKRDIAISNKRVELAKENFALHTMMKMFGWGRYDVSDYVSKGHTMKAKWSFIGTEQEYIKLLEILEPAKK